MHTLPLMHLETYLWGQIKNFNIIFCLYYYFYILITYNQYTVSFRFNIINIMHRPTLFFSDSDGKNANLQRTSEHFNVFYYYLCTLPDVWRCYINTRWYHCALIINDINKTTACSWIPWTEFLYLPLWSQTLKWQKCSLELMPSLLGHIHSWAECLDVKLPPAPNSRVPSAWPQLVRPAHSTCFFAKWSPRVVLVCFILIAPLTVCALKNNT